MRTLSILFVAYLIVINLVAFSLMGIDKNRAVKQKWRISEKALFISAIIGGSIGSIVGMQVFRHKTKHWYFSMGMPLILILQCLLAWFITFRL